MKDQRRSIWVQIFLANKYMNEFLKQGLLKEYGLTPYDYFLLLTLRAIVGGTFYEISQNIPLDSKSLHKKINLYVEKGLVERIFEENGTSKITLTDEARKILREIFITNIEDTEEYFEPEELLDFHVNLRLFNEKMRKILGRKPSPAFLSKLDFDLL